MIRLTQVSHSFSGKPVLSDIDLTLSERRIGIVGANGSGKSTFARLLNGLIVPEHGKVTIDDVDTATHGRVARARVGFVFQNPDNQIVYPVVAEDIAFGLKNLKLPAAEVERRRDAIMARLGLDHLKASATHLLSGGEKQLLAIAGVLVMAPDTIVFDEPTTLLDLRNRNTVARIIDGLDQRVITVSHDLDLVAGYDRVLVFDAGRLIADDAPPAALERYRTLMA